MKDSGVIFLKDWKPLVSSLSIENQIYFWELFTSYEYGVEQKCDNEFVKPIWNFIKSQLDNMKEKYNEKVVERNKANGSKGGRPRKPKETQGNPKNPVGLNETQKTHKDKDKDNDKDNENENNNEKENINYYRCFSHLKISFEEFEKLKEIGYSKQQIDDVLDSIENFKKNTNYTSLFLTAKKWLKKEPIQGNEKPKQIFSVL